MALADHRGFLPLTRALVRRSTLPDAPTLFRELGLPKPTGYRILRFYTYHGAVTNEGGGMRADRREVVRLAGALRLDQAIPDRTIPHGIPAPELSRHLALKAVPHAFAFETAANRIGYFEPSPATSVYVDRRHFRMIRDFVVAHHKPGETRLHDGPLDRIETMEDVGGLPITTPAQTLLDLATSAKGSAHLDYLEQVTGVGPSHA